jgi:signal transduction histidine kinase
MSLESRHSAADNIPTDAVTRQRMLTSQQRTTQRIGAPRPGLRSRIRRVIGFLTRGHVRIWVLNAGITGVALLLAGRVLGTSDTVGSNRIPWFILAGAFYLAEIAVVHLQYRRDAHSFSMSEVPLVLGMFFTTHLDLILAQLVGNLIALTVHRRQPPVKLAFNLGQFTMQTAVAVLVFRGLGGNPATLGPQSAVAAVLAALAALYVAHALVVAAIYTSGGRESLRESLEVLGLSSLATLMNALLALGGVVIVSQSNAEWLAAAPPVFLYLAYRAYVGQRQEKGRLSALFEATKSLHKSPQIDRALVTAGNQAMDLVKAEFVRILLFPQEATTLHYVTEIGPGEHVGVMRPRTLDPAVRPWPTLANRREPCLLVGDEAVALGAALGSPPDVREAVVVPLLQEHLVVGLMIAANRIGDVSSFGDDDVRLLATLGSQVSVSLENGRLTETLGELRRLKEQLEKLVASKDQLIASVSHELRTPLTGVVGLAQMLREDLDTMSREEMAELVGMIADQGTELSNIVEDLLVQARADIGTLTVSPKMMDLDAEIAAVVSSHKIAGDLRVEVPKTGAKAFADPLRFRQVFRNLLTNAQRYGGKQVWIEVESSGRDVRISVCDNGTGVPPGMEEAIFEPYQSAHDQRSQPGSVGLGLAVSRKISRLMDGDLRYRRGTEFTAFDLVLPVLFNRR